MTDVPLFPGYDPGPAPESTQSDGLSPGQRRTVRQARAVANGVHPLVGGPLHPEASREAKAGDRKGLPFTCGSCVHRVLVGFPKCDVLPSGMSHSEATDVRAWWPACRDGYAATGS